MRLFTIFVICALGAGSIFTAEIAETAEMTSIPLVSVRRGEPRPTGSGSAWAEAHPTDVNDGRQMVDEGRDVRPSSIVPHPSVSAGQTVIVVVGAGGEPEFGRQFVEAAGYWKQACEKGGVKCVTIGLDEQGSPSDREKLQGAIEDVVGEVRGRDALDTRGQDARDTEIEHGQDARATGVLWVVLLGHGTFDGRVAKFNVRGPDVSADELGKWLGPVERPVAIINTASSSAPFLTKLSGKNRVVVTATKSGFEQNFTRFGQYLARTIAETDADLDKDGQTSLLEAFLMAANRTAEFYKGEGRLATEHPLIDDNGDGLGTRADWFRGIRPVEKAADGAELDGYRAHQFHVVRSAVEVAMDPEQRSERDRLELEVLKLRDAQEMIDEDIYLDRLEGLLMKIAELYKESEAGTDDPNS